MAHYFALTIPFGVKKLWDEWNIRGAILFSLWLQIVLIFAAPIRKSARRKRVIRLIWYAYLLADATANFTLGLICNSQRNQFSNPESESKQRSDLLAFWAPFLLLHLGGPDTITAYSLEDNQLWRRHLLGLVYQVTVVVYVFLQSFPNGNLWIPTSLMFIAGTIRYVERTLALYFASLDKFRDSILKPPDAGADYSQLMDVYASRREARIPTQINITLAEEEEEVNGFDAKEGDLKHLEVVNYAYKYFQLFKGLVVDLIFESRELNESRDFFNKRTAEDALRIIEIELNLIYDAFYTKVEVVHWVVGYVLRFIAFGSVLATLGLFYFQAKDDKFHAVDIRITYTLLLGAVALDVIAFLMLIFSDRTFGPIKDPDYPCLLAPAVALFTCFLALNKPWWYRGKCSQKPDVLAAPSQKPDVLATPSQKHSPCQKHHVLATPSAFLRRWSGSISTYNLIRYSLKSSATPTHEFPSLRKVIMFSLTKKCKSFKIIDLLGCTIRKATSFIQSIEEHVSKIFSPVFRIIRSKASKIFSPVFRIIRSKASKIFRIKIIKDLLDEIRYVSHEPFTKELCEFIFKEVKIKSEFANTVEIAQRISSARGDWVLTGRWNLLKYVSDVPYDESLLLWHIATDLCYHTDTDRDINNSHRECSKILSDYMLYLLIFQPTMMSAVAGIGQIRFRDTGAEAKKFFERRRLGPNHDQRACEQILSVNTDVEPVTVKGNKSKSVLFEASMLAQELTKVGEEKWKLLCRVWVELVSYAACRCSPSALAQQVSKGGELINFVWLLTAQFGLGAQFQISEGYSRASCSGKVDVQQNIVQTSMK
ncbi:hypothetical protein PTKIN_Ptkin05aG0005900 [Pterospermum kingtungense]